MGDRHYLVQPNCGAEGTGTTARKDVTCEACLDLMGPDPEKAGKYHFEGGKTTPADLGRAMNKYLFAYRQTSAAARACWEIVYEAEQMLRQLEASGVDIKAEKLAVHNERRRR